MARAYKMIVATSKNLVIGKENGLPWNIPEDMSLFSSMTRGHIVIMGFNTYKSICEFRGTDYRLGGSVLKDRIHVVIVDDRRDKMVSSSKDVVFCTYATVDLIMETLVLEYPQKELFVIGGAETYRSFASRADTIYLTLVNKTITNKTGGTLTRFPAEILEKFKLVSVDDVFWSKEEDCEVQFLTYGRQSSRERYGLNEDGYLKLLGDILIQGEDRPDRTGVGTKSIFGSQLRFRISEHIPILTTKTMAWKACIKELLWFLRGDTDAKLLQAEGVHIWDGNTSREFLDARGLNHLPEGDIGAGYGFQWRHFGGDYTNCESNNTETADGNKGVDQITEIIESIKKDPYGRRHILSAWNPTALDKMALPPCHIMCQFYVGGEGTLSCHMYQRSVDCFLGLPFNIMSYATLTYLIALKTGLRPKELIISTGDTHIYQNHLEQVYQQVKRSPLPLPRMHIAPAVAEKDWKDITIEDFMVYGYMHHPAIKAEMAV